MRDNDENDALDATLAIMVRASGPSKGFLELVTLAAEMGGLGRLVKAVAFTHGWFVDDRKPDRVFDALLAIRDRLHAAEQKRDEYVRKDEFKDLFEETLRRLAEQPDPERRCWLRAILLKVIDEPLDHAENRLFVRLADELTTRAHKVLTVLSPPVSQSEGIFSRKRILAMRAGIEEARVEETLEELALTGLTDRKQFEGPGPTPGIGYSYLLTPRGKEFLAYRGGT
jgi:hypothetical protein